MDWHRNRDVGAREYEFSNFSQVIVAKRQAGPEQDAPYAVAFPFYSAYQERVLLPGGGGFSVVGSDIDTTIAGYEVSRTLRLDNGVAVLNGYTSSVAPEFPASESTPSTAPRNAADDPPTVQGLRARGV